MASQRFEQSQLSGSFIAGLESADRCVENGQCPAAFEDRFWRDFVDRLQAVAIFCGIDVDGQNLAIAASLLRTLSPLLVRDELIEAAQQERSKAPLLGISTFNSAAFKQRGHKRLRQILSVHRLVAATSEVGVKRVPVGRAKFRQRVFRLRRADPNRLDHRPPRRCKSSRMR